MTSSHPVRLRLSALSLLLALGATAPCLAAGLDAAGNTDGVLTWRLGDLAKGQSVRQVVLFAFDASPDALAKRLEAARQRFAKPTEPARPAAEAPVVPKVWIKNDTTDFALEGPGFFRWRLERQSLACAQGGQLSQFTYYVHWRDGEGEHRAGIPNEGDSAPENLQITQPVCALSETEALGVVETADKELRLRVHALMGQGPVAAVEFVLTNTHAGALTDVRLSVYGNLEGAHTHDGDYSFLDARTESLLVYDPPTKMCAAIAGLERPATGYVGTWNSVGKCLAADGIPFDQWQSFAGLPPEVVERLAAENAASQGIYLPYLVENPTTPETRTLTPAEAQEALERDWLFQSMGSPLIERSFAEIGWARALAARLATDPHTPLLKDDLTSLDQLERRLLRLAGKPTDDGAVRDLYFAIRQTKRRIAFSNPVLDFSSLLFIDQPYPRGRVNDIHEAIHRMGITATPGGRLLVLTGLHPGGTLRRLAPDRPGSFWRPDLSFDGKRVLFCYKAHEAKSFHLYEMNLDGTGLHQLTDSNYDDIDPLYLPDGHLLFTTTRGNSYVRCGPFIYSYILARCDADGGNVYLTSYNGEPDFVPALLNDGRVAYSRWEYTDKPLWRAQSLWTTNQDGTNTMVLWGNQSVWPDHLSEPRPIPGSPRVMFSGVGHHDWWSGSIGIVDPTKGLNFPDGLTKVTCDVRWPECSQPPTDPAESEDYHASGPYTGYKTAYPLSEKDFLVSARGDGGKFRLYLMDVDGNRELIYEGVHNIWHAIPVKPRLAPPQQPDRVVWPGTGRDRKPVVGGTFYSADVYAGVPDLPRGSAKYLRVFQLDHKTYSTWQKTYRHSGPPVSIIQEEGVKRILSEVPVEPDGSVYFEAPAGHSLYFQLLDERYRCLQTMRSFAGLMPGEQRGCVGCHESHSVAPPEAKGRALLRPPTKLTPPPWGTESLSYERFAQPVLDRYCGKCHQGEGAARAKLDLTLRPGTSVFKEPYLTLVGSAGWGNPVAGADQPGYGIAGAIPVESMDPTRNDPQAYGTLRPLQYLSANSKLIEIAMNGKHHGVKVDAEPLRRLLAWVDACCPFMGEEEVRALGDPNFEGIDLLPIRPRVATAPVVERP
ncbi:MAG: hypothetical protein COZ06_27785 [Armatimonadetes bacterium CG_4_10_14_3_um_filter_66_18]|nr:hypothetical protein [Armatimonadota bacterium]OIO98896.1 MAG: hypothetical protein AUJ96_20350 [Armatimonadetes bacterium CG2_30_66_41]PIU94135.1 MAG: hypothetical protein COS65_09140 [Armatimonadetes bacterium CG06_land_8_20_14_3_00_66_21]PIX45454.1 MAG: hypothetical protein COZ57_15375 [Armatimonadetes bacterium CG_4_8_14_3_um_filter_66_20]PIY40705.1 MAG: hypothetical protein COZ06_27785 [Armatimonadetes bacterium CG_4_10_14_3_um_filter_66_18]PIZ33652.1 MAG: hypothetical protein COY42_29